MSRRIQSVRRAVFHQAGRAAQAKAIIQRPLFVAWGTGESEWDSEGVVLPDYSARTSLINPVGYRIPTLLGFVTPNENGDIATVKDIDDAGIVTATRYSMAQEPTPYIYVLVNYDFADAHMSEIREIGLFMDTEVKAGLPPGQRYFTPAQIEKNGMLLASEVFAPGLVRSSGIQQSFFFILPV